MNRMFFTQIVCIFLFACNMNAQTKQVLSANEFEQQMSGNIQLLDVRTSGEYNSGHIAKALQADWKNQSEFSQRVQYLDKNKKLLVYCQGGGRSATAAKWLRENGFNDVEELQGGMIAWKQADKPVEGAVAVKEMTAEEYNTQINSGNTVLVDFGAEWCPPCKKMEPVIAEVQKELKNKFTFVKVDGGVNTTLMKSLNVEGIPAFIIYKKGKEVWRQQGIIEKEVLLSELKK